MALDRDMVWKELSQLWKDPSIRELSMHDQKFVIISDTHLGDGGNADDFSDNERALLRALQHYQEKGFNLILLGDIEELWQFDLSAIERRYEDSVYAAIKDFGDERVFRLFGNHDYEWGGFKDPIKTLSVKTSQADEAIKLKDKSGKIVIFLVHGHQGSIESQKYAWFSRFFARIFKGIEPLAKITGFYGHSSATKSQITKDYERTFYQWAKQNKVILICGHSHRAIFSSRSHADTLLDKIAELEAKNSMNRTTMADRKANFREIEKLRMEWRDEMEKGRIIDQIEPNGIPLPCYFNSGCGLYTDGITTIEIGDDVIKLVKWRNDTIGGPDSEMFNSGKLSTLIKAVVG